MTTSNAPAADTPAKPRIGIIGGYGHECVRPLPGAEIARALDGYDDAARRRAEASPECLLFPDMDRLIEEFSPGILYIGSAYGRNGDLVVAALERGLSVVCEKPIATDWDVLRRIEDLTADGHLRVIADFAMRWSPTIVRAREIIKAGGIGSVVMAQAQKSYKFGKGRPEFYKTRELFGGIIPWVAIHAIDWTTWCCDLRFESVTATHGLKRFSDYPGMEDHASMLFRMEGGVPAVVTSDFMRPGGASSHSDDRLRITGTEGVVEARGDTLFVVDSSGERTIDCPMLESVNIERAVELFDAANGGEGCRLNTPASLQSTAAALAARESADSGGKWVEVPRTGLSA